MSIKLTILGCGSSGGVPRLGNIWGACDSDNPKNARMRCSVLLEKIGASGTTRVLIDSSPDMRQQLLNTDCGNLDAVVFTHEHADHTHGIDDLRMIVLNQRKIMPVYADKRTQDSLFERFGYAFKQPEGSPYPPILAMNEVTDQPVEITGEGGTIALTPIPVQHGAQGSLGFRIGEVVYLPDVSDIPDTSLPMLENISVWILDCLRETPHPSHFNLETSLNWIERMAPAKAILTNLHVDLDYHDLDQKTPAHVTPAFDGMSIEFDA